MKNRIDKIVKIDKIKRDSSFKKKGIYLFLSFFVVFFLSFLFLFYGPWDGFRNVWITSAMHTMSHQHYATWFYSDETIRKVLAMNRVVEVDGVSNRDDINVNDGTIGYANKYEKELLEKDADNDLYKVIKISGLGYRGFLVAIYDPSKISVATTDYLGVTGQDALEVAKKESALVVINASGFYDPNWNSNGSLPHGTVISGGVVVSDYADSDVGGGFIGFTNENKLVLGKMDRDQALELGYRDAIEFGPYLIINGKRSIFEGNGGWGLAPRTAIGQRRDGIVLLLVINGRLPSSIGASLVDLAEIMERYGAYNAANLDGGSSSVLVVDGKIVNTPVGGGENGLRKLATFWVVKK